MDKENLIIETVGSISKKEDLVLFDHAKNILVFETAHAFPGYNSVVPENYDPNSLFLICKERYLTEEIFRISQNVKKLVKFSFNAAAASVDYQNKTFPAIRVKGLENYSFITKLLDAYVGQGVNFEKKKSIKISNTLIKVTKEFCVKPIGDGCYKDTVDPHMYYFEIPQLMDWDAFQKVIMDIKYNTKELNFDAAIALFYRTRGIVDSVRVYSKSLTVDELLFIREKFLKLL